VGLDSCLPVLTRTAIRLPMTREDVIVTTEGVAGPFYLHVFGSGFLIGSWRGHTLILMHLVTV